MCLSCTVLFFTSSSPPPPLSKVGLERMLRKQGGVLRDHVFGDLTSLARVSENFKGIARILLLAKKVGCHHDRQVAPLHLVHIAAAGHLMQECQHIPQQLHLWFGHYSQQRRHYS